MLLSLPKGGMSCRVWRVDTTNKKRNQDSQVYDRLVQRTLWRSNPVGLVGGVLLVLSLIIGPLYVGSYFDHWRWPLLYCSAGAIIVILISQFFYRSGRKTKWSWLLLPILLWPAIQGCWMYYNAWGVFNEIDYSDPGWFLIKHPMLAELDNQPYPELPGTAEGSETLDRMTYIIPCLGLIWCTRALVLSRPSWGRMLSWTIYGTGLAVALIGFMLKWTDAKSIYWLPELATVEREELFFGTYRSPGIAACYLNIALAMGLSIFLAPIREVQAGKDAKRRLARAMLHITALITLTTASVTTGSKTGFILTGLTLIAWAVLNRRTIITAFHRSVEFFPGNRHLERNLVAICIACIALIAVLRVAGNVTNRWQDANEGDFASLAGRGAVNAMQIEMVRYKDWGAMGYGPGSFYPLFPYFAKGHDIEGIYVYSHNDFLQTLVEWGWLGTSCFALIFMGAVYFLMRGIFLLKGDYRKKQVIFMRGYLIAITVCLLHALIDFPFQIESIAITISVLLGIAWAMPALRIPERETADQDHPAEGT